jgi:phenylalanine-4-hydroxylase
VAAKIPSVAGAAADPAAWDKAFGQLDSFTSGDAEAKARANRMRELSSQLASMYTEVRTMREQQTLDRARLLEISKLAPSESLLQSEVSELLN